MICACFIATGVGLMMFVLQVTDTQE